MRNTHLAVSFAILLTIALAASAVSSTQVVAITPTSATQTLMTRLSPENATLGQAITWLTWTDPALPGQAITLTITDLSNDTVIYQANKNLNNTNPNSQPLYQLTVNTVKYSQHNYQFMVNTTVGNMKIQSMKYQNFVARVVAIKKRRATASPINP